MKKFKNATKKITAVAAAATLVSSSAFAALGNYPQNFVEDGKFMGDVVVGSTAAASDTTAALSLIEDLKAEFSGDSEKVKIVARKSTSGGDSVSAVDSTETLNFGETLQSVREELDEDVSDLLQDEDVDNKDYTQELILMNGDFEYRIFDEVDGEDTAKAGLYYDANDAYAQYVVDFEDSLDISSSTDREALVGEEMRIMGNDFTIVEIDQNLLVLIGGSNSVAVGEGASTTVTVDGNSYEVEVLSVDSGEVYVQVNGQSKVLDEYEVDDISGVSVAVIEAINRDDNEGYAQLVIGGQKVELDGSRVKINDEDLDDVYEDFEVDVDFSTNTATDFNGVTLTYRVDENTVLAEGESLNDILFNSFALTYEGTNDVEYSEFKIMTSKDDISFDGTMNDGAELPSEFEATTSDNSASEALYLGSSNERIYFANSNFAITDLEQTGNMDAILLNSSLTTVALDIDAATTDVAGTKFFSYIDDDEYYLYEINSVNDNDQELDFTDLFSDDENNAVDYDDVQSELELPTSVASTATSFNAQTSNFTTLNLSNLGSALLELENALVMDFSDLESEGTAFDSSSDVYLEFSYNSDDIDMDNTANESDSFRILFNRATDFDTDAIEMTIDSSNNDFVSNDEVEEDSDFDVYVDHYGTMVTIDAEDFDDVTIAVPDEEVEAKVTVSFGSAAAAETQTWTVDEADLEETRENLESDGWTIISTDVVSSEEVDFDLTAPILDTEFTVGDNIVIGGPAVNAAARAYLGIDSYTIDQAGVNPGEGVARYFEDANSVLIYGYSAEDTVAIVERVNAGTATFE